MAKPQLTRAQIAALANEVLGTSFTARSTRGELITYMERVDPNGVYSDEAMIVEYGSPATTEELWDSLLELTEGAR